MSRKVYSAAAPGRLPDTSRAKGYTSRYMENRWSAWDLALKDAATSQKLATEDYKGRLKLYNEQTKALQKQLADAQGVLADYREGIVDRQEAAEKYNATATDKSKGSFTSSSRTGSSVRAPSARESGDPQTILNNAGVRLKAQDGLSSSASALADRIIGTLPAEGSIEDVLSFSLNEYERRASEGSGLSQTDKDLARTKVVEGAMAHLAQVYPGLDIAALRGDIVGGEFQGLDASQQDSIKEAYVAANQVGKGDPLDGAPEADGEPRVSQSASNTRTYRSGYDPTLLDVPEEDQAKVAEMEAAIVALDEKLKAMDVPEMERRSLIEEAQDSYRRNFGLDAKPRAARGRGRQTDFRNMDQDKLRAALERGGFLKPEPVADTRTFEPVAQVPLEVPSTENPDLAFMSDEAPKPSLKDISELELAKARSAGATIGAQGGAALEKFKASPGMEAVVQLWTASGDDAQAEDLAAQVREAYGDKDVLQATTLLYALQAARKKGTMYPAPGQE